MGRILIGGFAILSAMTLATSPSLAQDQAITVTGQAQSKWKEAESDHFKIYGIGDEKYLTKLSGRLEAVHYLLKIATRMQEPADGKVLKVKVYVVDDIAHVRQLIGDPQRLDGRDKSNGRETRHQQEVEILGHGAHSMAGNERAGSVRTLIRHLQQAFKSTGRCSARAGRRSALSWPLSCVTLASPAHQTPELTINELPRNLR